MANKVTSKGQVTIPKSVRDHLGLKLGDDVIFDIKPDGGVGVPKRIDAASKAKALREARKHVVLDMTADQYLRLTRGDDWQHARATKSKPRAKTKPVTSRKSRAEFDRQLSGFRREFDNRGLDPSDPMEAIRPKSRKR